MAAPFLKPGVYEIATNKKGAEETMRVQALQVQALQVQALQVQASQVQASRNDESAGPEWMQDVPMLASFAFWVVLLGVAPVVAVHALLVS